MTKYFSKDTPLASLERMMMSVPGFQKRGGGMMVLCRFHYKKEDVDCAYCQSYMRHTCQASVCPYIPERLEAGTVKLEAVIVFAEPENAGAIRRLAENLEQFDFIPGIHTPEEYGRYMIRESGRFEYDDILEAFYDYEGYGQHRIQQENGRFSGYGYVSYPGTMALEDLMAEDPAEAYQAEQGLQMGGLE